MNAGKKKKGDDYYPLRWKFADFFENIIILYRTKAAIGIALLGALLVILGLLILGWNPLSSDDVANDDTPEAQVEHDRDDRGDPENLANPQAAEIDPTTVTRPVADAQQLQFTTSGNVIELGPNVMRLVGGQPSDEAADRALAIALEQFPNREVFDAQILSNQFSESDEIIIRLVEPTLFVDGTAELNPAFLSLFGDVMGVVFSNGNFNVEVTGHDNDQQLSAARAQAAGDQLVALGVSQSSVISTGLGNSQPIDTFTSRIDFIIREG